MLTVPSADRATKLLAWYDRHHRILPWRISPSERQRGVKADPYRIWLSEIMLQQTTVEAVKSYFMAFVQRWPTIEALAAASEDDILQIGRASCRARVCGWNGEKPGVQRRRNV